jgi:diadenosine tetraphosphate (Ap4A) HIT family hydrolase
MFALHQRLAADTLAVANWSLSMVLLMNDSGFPWLILVPQRENVREIHELSPDDRAVLTDEIVRASKALETLHRPAKINVGALGNLVPQLHVHVIARFEDDAAWPGPVWGAVRPRPYGEDELPDILDRLRGALDDTVV